MHVMFLGHFCPEDVQYSSLPTFQRMYCVHPTSTKVHTFYESTYFSKDVQRTSAVRQRMYCVQGWLMLNWTRYLCMKVTNVTVTRTWLVRPWNLPCCPAEMAGDQRPCCTGLIPFMQRAVLLKKLNWLNFFTFTTKGRSRSRYPRNEHLVVPTQNWYFSKPSGPSS